MKDSALFNIGLSIRLIVAALYIVGMCTTGASQTSHHYLQPEFRSFGGDMQLLDDGTVRMIGLGDNQSTLTAGMYAMTFSSSGERLETMQLDQIWGEYALGFATLPLADGSVLVLGDLMGCDYPIPLQLAYYDQSGMLIWYKLIEEIDFGYGPKSLALVMDSVIVVADDNQTEYFDLLGNYIGDSGELPYDLQVSLNTGFLVSRDRLFQVLDAELGVLSSIAFTDSILAFDTIAGGGYVILTDSLIVLDETLKVVGSTSVAESHEHVISTSSGYWLFDSENGILHLDTLLNVDSVYSLGFDAVIEDVLHIADTIFIAGTHVSNYLDGLFLVRTEAHTFLNVPVPDIGIIDIRFEDTIRYRPSPSMFPGGFQIEYGDIYVTLINEGSSTITSAYVKLRKGSCTCDGLFELSWRFVGFELLPADTIALFLTNLVLDCAYSPLRFGLHVVGPDDKPDGKVANNYFMADIKLITSTRAPLQQGSTALSVYPNPAVDEVFVELETLTSHMSGSKLSIFNAQGQMISQVLVADKVSRVSLDGLPSGVYHFVVTGDDMPSAIRKVIVVR